MRRNRDKRSQEHGREERKGEGNDGEKIGREGGGGWRRRGKDEVAEEGGGGKGTQKERGGDNDSHTEHLILGLCLALTAGKECFRLNHKKLPYWKQIRLWSRRTRSSRFFF